MDKLNRYWLILVLIGLVILIISIFRECGDDTDPVVVQPLPDSVFYWKNKYNEEVASQKGTAAQFGYYRKQLIDSLAKVYKVKPKDIEQVVIGIIESDTDIPPVNPGTPSNTEYDTPCPNCPPVVKSMTDSFANPWTRITVRLGEGKYLNMKSRDTITTLVKTVRQGNIFNRKTFLQVDMNLADTTRHVTGMKVFMRYEEPKDLSLVAGAEALYIGNKLYPMVGGGFERDSRRFNIGIGGGKEFLTNSFYGRAHLKLKIAKFK